MKKILLTLVLLANILFAQPKSIKVDSDVFNNEWFESLKDPINFITFNSQNSKKLEFRVYRGSDTCYHVTIKNPIGYEVFIGDLKEIDRIDISILSGVYYITAEDSKENKITKIITII